ncbi:unnamed protein product [Rotaria magnacalcarata]|uniref:Uncharacterized protein n=3 Tax=Rotaria magnacalcarata TaxID=392030 RepID=A0A8S2RA96_9BILA|nr:unnamed protein product [Rotaria magnacalcarata]CAF4262605.1 unnamed protein product [Rotaria magnacalcarata]
MPSQIVHCLLCDRRERTARSKFTTIMTVERQEKIYEGYENRHGKSLNYSLINKKVHVSCYLSITSIVGSPAAVASSFLHSTPKTKLITSVAPTIFKTRLLPSRSRVRSVTRFKKNWNKIQT